MGKTVQGKVSFYILIIVSFYTFVSCTNQSKYPESLVKGIDFFYLENQNQQALAELHKTLALHPGKEIVQLCNIFIAASICEENKSDSAFFLINQIDTLAIRSNSELMFWYNSMKGLILFRQNKLSQAYSVLDLSIANDQFDNRAIGLNQRIMARICISLGEYKKGVEWLVFSSNHFSRMGLDKSMAINHKILGRYYMTIGYYSEALKQFKLAEKGLLKSCDKLELFYIYINYLDYYLKQNDLDKAKYFATLSYNQYKNFGDNQMATLVYNNLGEIDFKRNNYLASIAYFQQTLNSSNDYFSFDFRNINALIGMSENFKQLKQPDRALRYALRAQLLAAKSGLKQMQFEANYNLAQCYRDLNMDKPAYCYMDTSVQYLDSAFKAASLTTKALYETKVDLVKASSDMENLKRLEKGNHIILVSTILALLALIVFGHIIYWLQQSRNKVLKELVRKNLKIIDEERKLSLTLQQQISTKKTTRKSTDTEKSDLLYTKLISWLENEKRFTQSDLTLESVARELSSNREYLSKAINDQNIRFTDLINKYRVQEAIRILTDSGTKNTQYKLSYIAFKVGFNSNSSFIDAFKKQTGLNPAEFRKNLYASE